jgi:hypothetical protein
VAEQGAREEKNREQRALKAFHTFHHTGEQQRMSTRLPIWGYAWEGRHLAGPMSDSHKMRTAVRISAEHCGAGDEPGNFGIKPDPHRYCAAPALWCLIGTRRGCSNVLGSARSPIGAPPVILLWTLWTISLNFRYTVEGTPHLLCARGVERQAIRSTTWNSVWRYS